MGPTTLLPPLIPFSLLASSAPHCFVRLLYSTLPQTPPLECPRGKPAPHLFRWHWLPYPCASPASTAAPPAAVPRARPTLLLCHRPPCPRVRLAPAVAPPSIVQGRAPLLRRQLPCKAGTRCCLPKGGGRKGGAPGDARGGGRNSVEQSQGGGAHSSKIVFSQGV